MTDGNPTNGNRSEPKSAVTEKTAPQAVTPPAPPRSSGEPTLFRDSKPGVNTRPPSSPVASNQAVESQARANSVRAIFVSSMKRLDERFLTHLESPLSSPELVQLIQGLLDQSQFTSDDRKRIYSDIEAEAEGLQMTAEECLASFSALVSNRQWIDSLKAPPTANSRIWEFSRTFVVNQLERDKRAIVLDLLSILGRMGANNESYLIARTLSAIAPAQMLNEFRGLDSVKLLAAPTFLTLFGAIKEVQSLQFQEAVRELSKEALASHLVSWSQDWSGLAALSSYYLLSSIFSDQAVSVLETWKTQGRAEYRWIHQALEGAESPPMSVDDLLLKLSFLWECAVFHEASEEVLINLSQSLRIHSYSPAQPLVSSGQSLAALYIVTSGEVLRVDSEGVKKRSAGPNEVVELADALSNQPLMVTLVAGTDGAQTLEIPVSEVHFAFAKTSAKQWLSTQKLWITALQKVGGEPLRRKADRRQFLRAECKGRGQYRWVESSRVVPTGLSGFSLIDISGGGALFKVELGDHADTAVLPAVGDKLWLEVVLESNQPTKSRSVLLSNVLVTVVRVDSLQSQVAIQFDSLIDDEHRELIAWIYQQLQLKVLSRLNTSG